MVAETTHVDRDLKAEYATLSPNIGAVISDCLRISGMPDCQPNLVSFEAAERLSTAKLRFAFTARYTDPDDVRIGGGIWVQYNKEHNVVEFIELFHGNEVQYYLLAAEKTCSELDLATYNNDGETYCMVHTGFGKNENCFYLGGKVGDICYGGENIEVYSLGHEPIEADPENRLIFTR